MKQDLLEFMRENEIPENMVWKNHAESQMIFVRDTLAQRLLHTTANVISTHYSKSIKLPVYEIVFNGITAILRENFYGWVISLKSEKPLLLEETLIKTDDGGMNQCYCEGFKEELVYPIYEPNCNSCSFRIYSDYDLYVLFYLLNKKQ